jgi:uncharacterized protein DUF222/HNH endonuclease
MFDVSDHLHELRRRPTDWLADRREELVREQRRLRVEELAVVRVLDERGALDDAMAARDGVSVRAARETVETARALESLPEIAAVAHAGKLSGEQLGHVAMLADEASDAVWAVRAPNTAPVDLARMARTCRKPTAEEGRARRDARSLRMWWKPNTGMLQVRGELPDVDGARFEATINRMVDRMRPPKGEAWDTRDHRGADALVELCDRSEHTDDNDDNDDNNDCRMSLAPRPLFVVEVPQHGPAEIAGIPLPDAMVEQLRANAAIEPVLVDDHGARLATCTRRSVLSPKITRAVLLRDGHCRWPGCERGTGLQIHHLVPRSWGGGDDIANLAAVCTGGGTDHHTKLVPHGDWILEGNPNQPDGLRLTRGAAGSPESRAGPGR